jgi:hypothetical protein
MGFWLWCPCCVSGATGGAALGAVGASPAAVSSAAGGDVAGGTDAEVQAAHQACTVSSWDSCRDENPGGIDAAVQCLFVAHE